MYEVDWTLDELAFPRTAAAVGKIRRRTGFENREAGARRIGNPKWRPGKGNGSIESGDSEGGSAVAVGVRRWWWGEGDGEGSGVGFVVEEREREVVDGNGGGGGGQAADLE